MTAAFILGKAEMLLNQSKTFKPVDLKQRIFTQRKSK